MVITSFAYIRPIVSAQGSSSAIIFPYQSARPASSAGLLTLIPTLALAHRQAEPPFVISSCTSRSANSPTLRASVSMPNRDDAWGGNTRGFCWEARRTSWTVQEHEKTCRHPDPAPRLLDGHGSLPQTAERWAPTQRNNTAVARLHRPCPPSQLPNSAHTICAGSWPCTCPCD